MATARQPVGQLRWIDYARRSMQRLGFLKWTLDLASPTRGQSLESLTRRFFDSVTKLVDVPPELRDAIEEYIRFQQLHRRYKPGVSRVEIQDIYLSDPRLPSHSGAITGDLERRGYRHSVYVEPPTWATRLRL